MFRFLHRVIRRRLLDRRRDAAGAAAPSALPARRSWRTDRRPVAHVPGIANISHPVLRRLWMGGPW